MSKKRFLWIFFAAAILIGILAVNAFAAGEPTLDIQNRSVSLDSAIYMNFKVVPTNVAKEDISLLIWTKPQASYTKGTEELVLLSDGTDSKGREVFVYKNIDSRKMTDVVYARAYATVNGKDVYSEPTSFSVVEYAYRINQLQGQDKLQNLIRDMLQYGRSAQEYFNYHMDFLATDWAYEVKAEGATLSDGMRSGIYKEGTTFTVTADAPAENMQFSYFEDDEKRILGATSPLTLTVNQEMTVRAVYDKIPANPDGAKGTLAHEMNYRGDAYVITGIGTYEGQHLRIPSVIDGYPVVAIDHNAFRDCSQLISVTIPSYVKDIGYHAFDRCENLTTVTVENANRDTIVEFSDSVFSNCAKLHTFTIEENVNIQMRKDTLPGFTNYQAYDNGLYLGNDVNPYYVFVKAKDTNIASCTVHPDTKSVSAWAFGDCTNLTSVTLPDTLESLHDYAFVWCSNLTSVTIPSHIKYIGRNPFSDCAALESFTMQPGNARYWVKENCLMGKVGDYEAVISGCKNSVIPTGTQSISTSAFSGCTGLTSITIPESIWDISDYAFSNCFGLREVNIASSWLNIYNPSFDGCNNLQSITVTADNTDYYVENNCLIEEYSKTVLAACVDSVIPKDVMEIGYGVFAARKSLDTIVIPKSVTEIGPCVFSGCSNLKAVYYEGTKEKWNLVNLQWNNNWKEKVYFYSETKPVGQGQYWHYVDGVVTEWGSYAGFLYKMNPDGQSCTITGVSNYQNSHFDIPKEMEGTPVVAIGESAFTNKQMVSVTIPEGITTIGDWAFNGCSQLQTVTLPQSLISIGDCAFCGSGLSSVTVPKNVTNMGTNPFLENASLNEIVIESGNTVYEMREGCLIDKNSKTVITAIKAVSIPGDILHIGERAFYKNYFSAALVLPENLVSVGHFSFESNAIKSVTIPKSVTSIGDAPFFGNDTLENITVASDNPLFYVEGNCLMKKDTGLLVMGYGNTTIPSGTTAIGMGAFSNNQTMKSVIIPDTVTKIHMFAFESCANLKTVVLPKTIYLDYAAFENCMIEDLYYCGTEADANQNDFGPGIRYMNRNNMCLYSETSQPSPGPHMFYWHWVNGVPTKW